MLGVGGWADSAIAGAGTLTDVKVKAGPLLGIIGVLTEAKDTSGVF